MKAVLALSGGLDSSTLLAYCLDEHHSVLAVGFDYGSKHSQYELGAAEMVADAYHVEFRRVSLTSFMSLFRSNLLIGQGDIPEGHYEAASMSQTVVPARNIIFASILAGLAWSENAQEVWLGIHAGDHAIYPDCRPQFFGSMSNAIHHGTDQKIKLQAPFLRETKDKIVALGLKLHVPYYITRTCYKQQQIACGKCGSCQERLAAFKANNDEDPLEYESREILPKQE